MNTCILITYFDTDSISEAKGLCDSAQYEIVHVINQKFLQHAKFGLSEGIIDELKEIIQKKHPNVVIFDEILKPSQNYNLASELKIEILDRESLILEIFERRAQSTESQMQVKLAQLRYEMSRAKEKVRLARMGEQPGFMGIGKFEVDVYYNDIKNRMVSVKSKLQKAGKQRELHRQARKRIGFNTVSIAGYTSAGKTTLFNSLTGEKKEKSSKLFTTLTTTTRKFKIENDWILISDTVGFISKLPAYLIEAFRSTLEELTFTDVVLVIIDAADSNKKLKIKFSNCMKTLIELGVERDKLIFVLNKTEEMNEDEINCKREELELDKNYKCIAISALTKKNFDVLKTIIKKNIDEHKRIINKNSGM
ncbi:MAG: GTPase HflX [Thermoproteota archaeon]|nr:GTPase HflX [Thermoproteota archaeon]